ncbi:MAG: PD-(D/E)XK nuclease family protein [Thermoanaerobaculia bacterium]
MPDTHSPFAAIAALCRDHLLREKILVVPSLAIGHQIADRIAREGTPWVNLRAETVRTLADAVTADALAAEGVTLLSRAQALALVERACAPMRLDYFASLADRPGLHRAIQRSIDDLRLAGATAASLDPASFEHPAKAADLRRILEEYETTLAEENFIDRTGVVLRAVRALESDAPRPWPDEALWIVVEEDERAEVESRLVELASRGEAHVVTFPGDAAAQQLRVVRTAGEENELRAVLRHLLASGRAFDEAEIAYATREIYLPLAWELASEHEIPATFAEGIAAHYTRPGKAAIELLRWIERWEDVPLRRAAQSGVLTLGDDLSGAGFARILREAAIGWGRPRYGERLAALEAERVAKLEAHRLEGDEEPWMEEQIERTRKAAAVTASLLEATPDADPLSMAGLAAALATVVKKYAAVRSDLDGMAKNAICRMLRELAAIPGEPLPKTEACDRLRDAVVELYVGASNPRPGHLHVAPVHAAAWSGRPLLFVAGLEESRYPGGATQDPILLDAERERLSEKLAPHRLRLLADRPSRVTAEFHRMMARLPANAEVTLSWPELDLRERREKFPSQVLLETFRASTGAAALGYEELKEKASPAGFVAEHPLSMGEWWLREAFTGGRPPLGHAPRRAYPWLDEGARAMEARASDAITRWDGRIDAPAEEVDPRLQERPYSASRLERMAACPFGYFLQSILGIEPLESVERSEEWLTAMEYGSLFHTVLERFMREICDRGEKPVVALHEGRLEEIAMRELEEKAREIPPSSRSAFEARRDDLLRSCAIFLRIEEKHCGEIDAKYFEVPFGFGDAEGELAMREPLEIELRDGRSVRMRGRIDRVDHHPARDRWHVWDYKSGSPWKYKQTGSLAGGTLIQHAIYARAVNEMLARRGDAGRVEASGYYFPTPKGRGERITKVAGDGRLEEALDHLFTIVGSGWFPQGDLDRCKFCDYPSICLKTKESVAAQESKCARNADERPVEAWVRLREVE